MSRIYYHDEVNYPSEVMGARIRQAIEDMRPCPQCGGDRLRQDFTGSGKCHVPKRFATGGPVTDPKDDQ